jgi:hypothetical protein
MIELQEFKNPTNILQQPKSKLVSNTFIKPVQEISVPTGNKQIPTQFQTFNKAFSASIIGILDDLLHKPSGTSWPSYLSTIIKKDQRPTHIGILFLVLALLFILLKM